MFTVIQDSREQIPYSFSAYDCTVEVGSLYSGDYSIRELESLIAIERKSLSDFIGCCSSSGRERFKLELHRLRGYQAKAVIIEASLQDIIQHKYRSRINPNSVIGSVSSWTVTYGIPFIYADNRIGGQMITFSLLKNFYQNQLKILHNLK